MTDFHCFNIGASSSGKTQHFDCCIRRFKSCRPSQIVRPIDFKNLSVFFLFRAVP